MASNPFTVIIVGAGFAGVTAAIECRLRGMRVLLVETYPTSKKYGDIIDFFPNGGKIIQKWAGGRIARNLMAVCINQGDRFQYYKYDGKLIFDEPWILKPHHFWQQYAGHRGQMHDVILDYAKELGVELRFGVKVVDYFESENEAGVVTDKGDKFVGDVVLAADGPRSLARQKVLHLPDTKVNSGYAIYRAYYTLTEEHRKNPLLAEFCNPNRDITKMWVAKDLHMIIYTWMKGKEIGWVLTHKDDHDIGESWSFPGDKKDVLKCLEEEGFEEKLKEVVKYTPADSLVDYKLVWRDPVKTWLSSGKRIAVIGDAAHCHLPTSAQGGSQAMEDGVAAAVALHRAKGDAKLGLQVFERIRFNRSHVVHMSSISNRDGYHNVDFDGEEIQKHPEILNMPRFKWVLEHDAEKNAEEHFDHLAADVRSGRQGTLEELSVPAGGGFEIEDRRYSDEAEVPVRANL
ncbi:salicylate hydroxylase [Cucurbitaria berberidis CBS 394.84]|uniref:Salicylate hydroxylase n=1 Tax=Cucurbitaria berberidis CBS 394.84 TaxID=1168544 RepID=A0A9P4LE95_9PLEO|nr:salicylate hydroxylase [Cucurbitaria berberidis CBS 394.84]KAF1851633.1 salicylate hydroxylase [Cucurbitaria berberidis CBS 394.84]